MSPTPILSIQEAQQKYGCKQVTAFIQAWDQKSAFHLNLLFYPRNYYMSTLVTKYHMQKKYLVF